MTRHKGRDRLLRAATVLVILLAAATPAAGAEEEGFSFFGVKFGMGREEIAQRWHPLSGDAYAVSSAAIRQVRPAFTHEGRLYELVFSVDLQFPEDPPALVNQAFQNALNAIWKKKEAGLIVTLAASREGNQVSITHEKLRDGYLKHLQEKVTVLLQP